MRTNRGAWAIGVMVLVGAVLGSVAVWFHYQQGRRAMEFWGAAQALSIRHATQVEVCRLERSAEPPTPDRQPDRATDDDSQLVVDGRIYRVVAKCDLATARGLVHARHALIVDASYDWTQPVDSASTDPAWQYAWRFSEDGRMLTLLLDPVSRRIRRLDDARSACLVPKIAAAEQAFFDRELARVERRQESGSTESR